MVFHKMKELILECYTEPENKKKSKVDDDLGEFGPVDDVNDKKW